MPASITAIRFKNEFRSESVNWLLANVGDKINIEIDLSISTWALSTSNDPFIINCTNNIIGLYWLFDPRGGFADFQAGDYVDRIDNTTGLVVDTGQYIVAKQDDFYIQLNNNYQSYGTNTTTADSIYTVKTKPTAVKYFFNLIENNEALNYNSKIDSTIQQMLATGLDATDLLTLVPLNFLGAKPYQIGSATIVGAGEVTLPVFTSSFTIVHQTFITPFMLKAQWDDILNNIAPDYFSNTNCLKFVTQINAYYDYNNPNRIITTELSEIFGNTGWFNENFNEEDNNYYIDSIVYKRPDTTIIPAIELSTTETTVEITIKNIIDSPFSNNNTKFTLNFVKAPQDEAEYQGNTLSQAQNFLFDRALQTIGSASVNGDNYGTAYQVLKTVHANFVSSSEILITAQIAMDTSIVGALNDIDEKKYMIFVAIQNHTLATAVADKVSLLATPNSFYEDATDPGMIVISNKYLRHFETNPDTEGVTALDSLKEDEVVAYTQFYVDKTGRYIDAFGNPITIQLISAEAIIKAKNSSTLEGFKLDGFSQTLSTLPVVNDNQYINLTQNRQFHIPVSEIRNKIFINRRTDLDASDKFYYEFYFPFMVRWEYFKAILTANGDFFDASLPAIQQNGWNNDWYRYSTFTDWGIYYEMVIRAKKNGQLLTYRFENQININDYESTSDYAPVSIKAYDPDTNTLLFDAINNKDFLLGYKNTRIEAIFSSASTPIDPDLVEFLIHIEVYEEGGTDGTRRYSSIWATSGDTWFLSTDGSDKVIKTVNMAGDEVKGTLLIDFTQIPLNKKIFKIEARIFDLTDIMGLAKMTEDSVFKFTDGPTSDLKIVEA